MRAYAFRVWVKDRVDFCRVVNHATAGRAKSEYLMDLRESWPDVYTDLRAAKLGPCESTEAFKRVARYRGMPDVRCGQRVRVGGHLGVIVGHNDSCNFKILFDSHTAASYAGLVLNVHPAGIVLEESR